MSGFNFDVVVSRGIGIGDEVVLIDTPSIRGAALAFSADGEIVNFHDPAGTVHSAPIRALQI